MYSIDFNIIAEALPELARGIKLTIFISAVSSLAAFAIGLVTVFARTMATGPYGTAGAIYVEIIRNTPLLLQLYFVYKALPDLGVQFPPVVCGIVALSIYTGAYISEVLRAGINSVTNEQYQAARGLGLSNLQAFALVVFPQAIRVVIPPLSSQFINLVKNSSLVSFIAVSDVFYVVYKGAADDFRFFEFFITGALVYMLLTGFIAVVSNIIEKNVRVPGGEARI